MQLIASTNAATAKYESVSIGRMAEIGDIARDFLRRALAARDWTPYRLAQESGVSATTISRPLNDPKYKFTPKLDTLLKISEATGVPLPAMLNVRESMDMRPVKGSIPVWGEVRAGSFQLIPDEPSIEEWLYMDVPEYAGANLFALRVSGRSMDKVYADGTYVIAAPPAETGLREGDSVVVRRYDAQGRAETTLKEVTRRPNGDVYLEPRSSDPEHQEAFCISGSRDSDVGVEVIGVVVVAYSNAKRGRGPLIMLE